MRGRRRGNGRVRDRESRLYLHVPHPGGSDRQDVRLQQLRNNSRAHRPGIHAMRNLILGLARPVLRLLGRDERGAVGVLVAMMLGAGVLTGMGALVIDVGQLYQERAELQNGADAAALAVAESCATGTCTPSIAAS